VQQVLGLGRCPPSLAVAQRVLAVEGRPMKAYRIENANGEGCWIAGSLESPASNPSPHCEAEAGTPLANLFEGSRPWPGRTKSHAKAYVFAFYSIDNIFQWYEPNQLREFSKNGHRLCIYEVADEWVAKGNYHLAFKRSEAVLVDALPLATALSLPGPKAR